MHKLHDLYMPADIQERALASFFEIRRNKTTEKKLEARQWLSNQIVELTGVEPNYINYAAILGNVTNSGETFSSDFHIDFSPRAKVSYVSKFIVVLADDAHLGTIFASGNEQLAGLRSEAVFQKTRTGQLALRPELGIEFAWEQASIGQLCSFNPRTDLHAAAPQLYYEKKLVISAMV